MGNLTAVPGWDAVPQIEVTTPLRGGPGGALNGPVQAVMNRTELLLRMIEGSAPAMLAARARPDIIAHRGFANAAPQNTLLAFSTAIANRADGLEFDVQPSADGVFYVFHDTTVDALTNGTGTFTGLSSAVIDALTFDATVGTPFASESIPRLADVLALAREAGVKIYPELKSAGWDNAQMTALLSMLDAYGFNNENCTLQANYIVYAEALRALSATVGIAYVGAGGFAVSTTFIDRMAAVGKASIAWNMNDLLAEPNFVPYAYSKGVDVIAWTVLRAEQIRQLRAIGVNRFMCDSAVGGFV